MGVRGAVHADRSEEDVRELAVAAASDDEQVGVAGGVDQGGPGVTLDHLTGDPERAVPLLDRGQ